MGVMVVSREVGDSMFLDVEVQYLEERRSAEGPCSCALALSDQWVTAM